MAISVTSKVVFRTGVEGTELRVVDDAWSLPANAAGSMRIDVGNLHKNFDTSTASHNMVAASLTPDEVIELFAAMDHAASLTITVGNVKPRVISLLGSTKVTNAYRTCAGIRSAGPDGGVNPFATGPTDQPPSANRPLARQQ